MNAAWSGNCTYFCSRSGKNRTSTLINLTLPLRVSAGVTLMQLHSFYVIFAFFLFATWSRSVLLLQWTLQGLRQEPRRGWGRRRHSCSVPRAARVTLVIKRLRTPRLPLEHKSAHRPRYKRFQTSPVRASQPQRKEKNRTAADVSAARSVAQPGLEESATRRAAQGSRRGAAPGPRQTQRTAAAPPCAPHSAGSAASEDRAQRRGRARSTARPSSLLSAPPPPPALPPFRPAPPKALPGTPGPYRSRYRRAAAERRPRTPPRAHAALSPQRGRAATAPSRPRDAVGRPRAAGRRPSTSRPGARPGAPRCERAVASSGRGAAPVRVGCDGAGAPAATRRETEPTAAEGRSGSIASPALHSRPRCGTAPRPALHHARSRRFLLRSAASAPCRAAPTRCQESRAGAPSAPREPAAGTLQPWYGRASAYVHVLLEEEKRKFGRDPQATLHRNWNGSPAANGTRGPLQTGSGISVPHL